MTTASTSVTRFFETYQHASAGSSSTAAALFADTFLAAGPDGAKAVPRAVFAPVLEKRKELFERLGCRPTELVSLEEIPLDKRYVVARTRWRMTFGPDDGPDDEFVVDSTFLVDVEAEHILFYLAHQDIFAVLRQRGILRE